MVRNGFALAPSPTTSTLSYITHNQLQPHIDERAGGIPFYVPFRRHKRFRTVRNLSAKLQMSSHSLSRIEEASVSTAQARLTVVTMLDYSTSLFSPFPRGSCDLDLP